MRKHRAKIYSVFLGAFIVMSLLTACGANDESVDNSEPPVTQQSTTTSQISSLSEESSDTTLENKSQASSENTNVSQESSKSSTPSSASKEQEEQSSKSQNNTNEDKPAQTATTPSISTEKPVVSEETPTAIDEEEVQTEEVAKVLFIKIGVTTFTASLADNATAKAFAEKLPLTIDMNDYGGFEKVGSLGFSLTTSDETITTQMGDLVLYNGNSIVVFYGSNSWSYTKLGKIDDISMLQTALGNDSVEVTFSIQ